MAKRQFRVLYRDFLRRIIDLEVLSVHAGGDASALFGQFVSLLILISIGCSLPALAFEGKLPVPGPLVLIGIWSLQHFLIATTMLVVGLFAVLTWNSTFPDKRDVLILAPLPVPTHTLFLAKIAAVGTALGITIVTLHALAGLVWPLAFNKQLPVQTVPAFTSDAAMAPVEAADMPSAMNRDLAPVERSGAFSHAGLAIGLTKHGVRRLFAYGAAKPDSIFEIGSVTKTFTGLLLAQMAAQGRVRLDEPVRQLLPPETVEKPWGREITLLDLATQHSGLPRMPGNFHPNDKNNPYADYHAADLYAFMATHGVKRAADTSFLYSNLGVGLLGQALANRARMTYPDLVRAEITDPLNLTDTVVSLSREQRNRFLQGYDEAGHPVHAWDLDALAGAGALHSTARDMLTYLEANLHPDSNSSLSTALVQSHRLRADMSPGMRIALVWWYGNEAGVYRHGGATPGYTADAFFNPKDDYAAIVLSNTGPASVLSADLAGEHIRQRLAGLPAISFAPVTIPASGGISGLIRLFMVYWITMLTAGGFIFCCILGLQGLAAQLLPRRLFLRASSFLQLAAFCLLISVYFLQPMLAMPEALIDVQSSGLPAWSPSYWFLGLFQQLNGSPALAPLARRAWIGLAVAVGGTTAAYALSYFRSLRKIIEEPDILPSARHDSWLPGFGTSLQTAIVQFGIRTLLRSRQHRVILAFYLGIGFAATIFLLKSPVAKEISSNAGAGPWHEVSMPLLAASIIMMGFSVIGVRAVFSLPLDLPANWIFRITPVRSGSNCITASRRALWVLAVAPVWAGSAAVLLSVWPWRPAAGHLIVLGLLGPTVAEFCLLGNHKIPFTCSWLPGKSNFHITFWLCIALILEIVLRAAEFERHAFENPVRYATILVVLSAVAACTAWRTSRLADSFDMSLDFEEVPAWQLVTLNLPRDGGLRPT